MATFRDSQGKLCDWLPRKSDDEALYARLDAYLKVTAVQSLPFESYVLEGKTSNGRTTIDVRGILTGDELKDPVRVNGKTIEYPADWLVYNPYRNESELYFYGNHVLMFTCKCGVIQVYDGLRKLTK